MSALEVGARFWFTDPVCGRVEAEVETAPDSKGWQDWTWGGRSVTAPWQYLAKLAALDGTP